MFAWLGRLFRDSGPQHAPETSSSARVPISHAFWIQVDGDRLAQGDLLPACLVPDFPSDFGSGADPAEVEIAKADLIVLTQSCDLENKKIAFVSFCPVSTIPKFEQINPDFAKKGKWEEVRQGRREGLYLLPAPTNPRNNREALILDFRQIISLPVAYVVLHATRLGPRWRLQSPYLEHFSQAFARFFMRVGLPSALPPYK